MGKRFFSRLSFFVSILLVIQLILMPVSKVLGATNGTLLPPSNLASQLITPDDVKLTWSSVVDATGYKIYEIKEGQLISLGTSTTNSYTINDLAEGSYTYVVSTLSSSGESGPCAPITVNISYPTMAAPTLTYTLQNVNDINLSWTTSQYAEGYKIYQIDLNGQKTLVTTVTGKTYTITNAAEGNYTYEVSSYHSKYGESTLSNSVDVSIVHPVMTAPTNLSYTTANVNDITLKWNPVTNATSYKIYQIVDGEKVLKSTVTGTSATYTTVPEGEYLYEVHSVSTRFGESAEGSQVTVMVGTVTMKAPSNLTYTMANGNDITLKWNAASNATSYKIYQIVDGQKVLKSTVTGTNVTYTNVPEGEYLYEVHSVSTRFGESIEGSLITVTIVYPVMGTPMNSTYTAANVNDITLKWDAVQYATSYKVYQLVNGVKVLKNTVSGTSILYSTLPEGDYDYEIYSYSSRFGESLNGAKISFSIKFPPVDPPANLTQVIKNATDFTLNWDAASNATSYKVYQIVNGQKVLKNTVTGTSINYTNMPPGDYTYEVHTYSSRFGESSNGSTVTFTLNGMVLPTPTNLTYSILNGNDIKLTWSSVTGATSYKVYQVINGQMVLKSTVTGTTVTYSNQVEGEYNYVVTAVSTLFGESPSGADLTFTLSFPDMVAPNNFVYKIQNGNDLLLTWGAVQYATSYKVYEIVDGMKVLKNTVTSTTTTLSNVSVGDHVYVVTSISSRFGESIEGSQISLTMNEINMEAPSNPTYSIINGNDIKLQWNAAPYGTNYKVYQIIDGQKVLKSTVTTTSTILTNMPEGNYEYEVHSYNSRYGESVEGSHVTLSLVFPEMQAPTNLTKSSTNVNDIVLRWNAVTYATNYKVYQIIDGQKILKSTVTSTSVSFPGMQEGNYEFEIHSYSTRFGESTTGSNINFDIVWPIVQPPVLKGTVFNGNNLTLSWQAVTWANEYRVYEITGNNRQQVYKGTALSTQLSNLTETTHYYEIEAFSTRFGVSAPSNQLPVEIVYPEMQPPVASVKLLSQTSAQIIWNFVTYSNGYNVYEVVDGKNVLIAQNVNNLSYTVSNLSYKNHEYYVTSYSNSFGESSPSNVVLAKLIVDTEAPVTTSNVSNNWTNQPAEVSLSASDNETGVANTYYSINDSNFVVGTTFMVSNEGINKITYYSVDKVGNIEARKTVYVKIDKTTPTTKSNEISGWYNSTSDIILSATDEESGVAKTYYSIDGSDFVEGITVNIDSEGVHQVSFYSIDQAGNKEQIKTIEVKIDKTAPVTKATAPTGWTNSDVTVDLSATDEESGIAKTYYSIDGLSFIEGRTVKIDLEGVHQISFYSIDQAGNKEQIKTIEVKVDKTAPVTKATAPTGWTNSDVTVDFSATDQESGVAKTYYSIDGSAYVEGTSVKVDSEGVHQVSFYSIDQVGNKEQIKTIEVKIDRTAPITSVTSPMEWSKTDVTVKLSATDEKSGVAKTYYSIDGSKFVEGTTVTIDTEGVHQVSFYSVDQTGNKEQIKTIEVKIDKTAPVTKATAPTGWSKTDVTVELSATDNLSGVVKTFYSIDGLPYTEGNVVRVQTEGIHKIQFYSVDLSGNVETGRSIEVKIDKTAPIVTMNLNQEYKLGDKVQLNYLAEDNLSGIISEKMIISIPNATEKVAVNGDLIQLDKPGVYNVTITVVNGAGLSTTIKKQFTVYIPATIEVTPKVIKGNKGVFTVRVDLPNGFSTEGFDLNSATINGVKALNTNNGYYNQAKNGQFKFERSDFTWNESEVTLVFRGYVNGSLVVGQTTVKVNQ